MGCCQITMYNTIAPSLKILKMLLEVVVDMIGESELVYANVKCFDNE